MKKITAVRRVSLTGALVGLMIGMSTAAFAAGLEPDPLAPSDVFGTFAASALTVLPWIAAGIAAAIGLYFALLGIRKGLAWFFKIVGRA